MDLEYLLDPYVGRDEIVKRWKEYLSKESRPTTQLEMESLAKEMKDEHHVPPEAISALFNRKYKKYTIEEYVFPKLKKFAPPSFKGTEEFEFSETELIDEVMQRLSYPRGHILDYGPNNGDQNAKNEWCHDLDSDNDENCNHGMMRCQCYINVPGEFFICYGCKKKVPWSLGECIRVPVCEDVSGGWGDFYCDKMCLRNFVDPTQMQDVVIDVTESCME